jgi:hypothetical protein
VTAKGGVNTQNGNAIGTTKLRPVRQRPPAKRMKREGGTEHAEAVGPPQRFPAPVARLRHKSYRDTAKPGRRKPRALGRGRSNRHATQPANNSKDTPQQTEPTGGTHRNEHAKRQRRNTKRQETHGRSDQTEDANAEHKQHKPTTKATGEAHRRAPGHAPHSAARRGPRHDRTKDRDARRAGHETAESTQAPETKQQNTTPHTTTQPHNAHNKRQNRGARGQQTEATSDTNPTAPPKAPKTPTTAKNRKTRAKKMVVGGKLLIGGKLQARKRPF